MALSETQLRRARYVRTVLSWHDWTQADLGRLLGVSGPAANRKLKGIRTFKDDELLLIADTFGLEPGLLLRPPALDDFLGTGSTAELIPTLRERWKNQLGQVSGHAGVRSTRFCHTVRVGNGAVGDRYRLPERWMTFRISGSPDCPAVS